MRNLIMKEYELNKLLNDEKIVDEKIKEFLHKEY